MYLRSTGEQRHADSSTLAGLLVTTLLMLCPISASRIQLREIWQECSSCAYNDADGLNGCILCKTKDPQSWHLGGVFHNLVIPLLDDPQKAFYQDQIGWFNARWLWLSSDLLELMPQSMHSDLYWVGKWQDQWRPTNDKFIDIPSFMLDNGYLTIDETVDGGSLEDPTEVEENKSNPEAAMVWTMDAFLSTASHYDSYQLHKLLMAFRDLLNSELSTLGWPTSDDPKGQSIINARKALLGFWKKRVENEMRHKAEIIYREFQCAAWEQRKYVGFKEWTCLPPHNNDDLQARLEALRR
jgi:hypothetical protein